MKLSNNTAVILSWACNSSPRHSGRFLTHSAAAVAARHESLNVWAAKTGRELRAAEDVPLVQAREVVEWALVHLDLFAKEDVEKALAELLAL